MSKRPRDIIRPIYSVPEDVDTNPHPIYRLGDEPENKERIVIVKTTENGKYNVGSMLLYNYKGISIRTDDKNAIFIDTINDSVTVMEYDKAMEQEAPTDPNKENVQYLIVMYGEELGEITTKWESVVGRANAYDYIRAHIHTFDPYNSIVLTPNVAFKDALKVADFVKLLQSRGYVEEDGFDIDEFRWE